MPTTVEELMEALSECNPAAGVFLFSQKLKKLIPVLGLTGIRPRDQDKTWNKWEAQRMAQELMVIDPPG